ncbi:MAG: gliding motility-associated C-terminal domain-containing protein [Lewinellaceae bacterium]|nr:gliding motility-associated C-terminal domain-containing protein [Lewinellaceae bacterium]
MRIWSLILLVIVTPVLLTAQLCGDNSIINPGFEEVELPCGPVPPGGLINGSFNSGCMTGWEAAWGTPSVCAFGPNSGSYFACFGANNEAIHQNLEDLCTEGIYHFSFFYRRLSGSTGSMGVYFANGLINQPLSNTGNPPLGIQGGWNLIVNQNVNSGNWQQYVNYSLQISNPANNQLLFVLSGAIDIGIDDVELELQTADPAFTCESILPGSYTFSGELQNAPPNYNVTSWSWDFGDGSTGSGQDVSHVYSSQGTYEVCLTITDACNCSVTTCQTIIYDDCSCGCDRDEAPPFFLQSPEPVIEVSCLQDVPVDPVVTVQDECDDQPMITFSETSTGPSCDLTITRTWLATDRCGFTAQVSQTIHVRDLTPPDFVIPPANEEAECPDHVPAFENWIQNLGGAEASDNCGGDMSWTVIFDSIPQYPCGFSTVQFQVSDGCGNSSERTATFFSLDTQLPEIVSIPEDLTVFCLSDISDPLAQWIEERGGFLAEDLCGPVTYSNDFDGDTSGQIIPVTFTATDLCGNSNSLTARFIRANGSDTLYVNVFTCDPAQAGQDTMVVEEGGCQVWSITNSIYLPPDVEVIEQFSCDPLQVGSDTLYFSNQNGCDSVQVMVTVLLPSDTIRTKSTTCDPAVAGSDTIILSNQLGCDSILISEVSLSPSSVQSITLFTCDPAAAGSDTIILSNQFGCDSVIYQLTVFSGFYQEVEQVLLCGNGNAYTDTMVVTSGPCDSLFITNYMYAPLDTTWLFGTTCDPAQAGISIAVQPSSLGCDSTIVTTTNLLPSDSTLVSRVTCDPAGAMYSITVLSNQYGCDSVVTTDIQYVGIDTLYVEETTCEPSQAGTMVSILPGVECDTVLVTETMYVPFTQSEETVILCGQSGVLSDTIYLQNAAGCDSLVIRNYEYVSLSSQYQIQGETCAGDQDGSIELTSVVGGVPPYEGILIGGNWQSATLFDNLPPGQYTLVIRDAAGCLDTLSGLVVAPGAIITIDAGPDRTAAPGEVIDLSAQTTQSLAQVQWTATDPLLCPGCLQTILGPLTTNQTVIVTGWTQEGCSDTDALEVIIKTRGNIFIPNTFTPNNDGINDVFSVYGNDQVLQVRNLAIFDRWGNALYSRSDLPINDPSAGWDGTFRDEVMDPGVYVYVVEVELVDGSVRLFKGDVTVVR